MKAIMLFGLAFYAFCFCGLALTQSTEWAPALRIAEVTARATVVPVALFSLGLLAVQSIGKIERPALFNVCLLYGLGAGLIGLTAFGIFRFTIPLIHDLQQNEVLELRVIRASPATTAFGKAGLWQITFSEIEGDFTMLYPGRKIQLAQSNARILKRTRIVIFLNQ